VNHHFYPPGAGGLGWGLDNELLIQFKKVEKLPEDKKKLVKEFLDAFLFKDNVQKQLVL